MQYKVAELERELLDMAVAKAEGYSSVRIAEGADRTVCQVEMVVGGRSVWTAYLPHVHWSVGGPIIERENIALERTPYSDNTLGDWSAAICDATMYPEDWPHIHGPTPLIAAMRAYAVSKFGETVELP